MECCTSSSGVSACALMPLKPVHRSVIPRIQSSRLDVQRSTGCMRVSDLRRRRGCRASAASSDAPVKDPFATKEVYQDGIFNMFFIRYFSKKMAQQLGVESYKDSYDGFVDLSKEIMRGRTSKQQRDTVAGVLDSLLPKEAAVRFRKWFPLSQFSAEANAFFTMVGFSWLVGPMDMKKVDVQFNGSTQTWNSGVQIKKCRYLEQSGCVGMCVNMCKRPTETFFTEKFGLPLTMNPNFEDLSCEMVFGQMAPPFEEDPVYNQPCFVNNCSLAQKDRLPCPKLDTERARGKSA
eukprot:jgi/Botrbrau1/13358/Bobra.0158s0011.1